VLIPESTLQIAENAPSFPRYLAVAVEDERVCRNNQIVVEANLAKALVYQVERLRCALLPK